MAKKFQSLGQINAFEKPIEFEYKPLGLEAFAQPLAQMQQRYDVTEQSLDESKFGIEDLYPDTPRSKQIVEKLEKDKQDVLLELEKTGNAKAAAKALRKLNTFWNEDPEVTRIKTQRAKHLKDVEEAKKRFEAGKINKEDADKETVKTLLKFDTQGGSGSREDILAGKGNMISSFDIHDNLEEDLMKDMAQLAKSTPEWSEEFVNPELIKLYEKYGGDGIALTTRNWRNGPQVAEEVFNFITNSDRYKDFLTNRAERDAYLFSTPPTENTGNPYYDPNFVEKQILDTEALLERNLALAKQKGDKGEIEKVEQAIKNFGTAYTQALNSGTEKKLAENLYVQNYADNFQRNLAAAAGDLYDFDKTNLGFTGFGGSSGKASKELEMPNGLELDTQAVETNRLGLTASKLEVAAGTAVSDTPNQTQVAFKEFSQRYKEETKEAVALKEDKNIVSNLKSEAIPFSPFENITSTKDLIPKEAEILSETGLNFYNSWSHILNEEKGYAEIENKATKEIAELNTKLSQPNLSPAEIEKIKAERNVAVGTKSNIAEQRQSLFASLDFDIKETINELPASDNKKLLQKAYTNGGVRGVSEFLTSKIEISLANLGGEISKTNSQILGMSPIDHSSSDIARIITQAKENNEFTTKEVANEFTELSSLLQTVNNWNLRLNASAVPSTKEILMNEKLKKATNGVSEQFIEEFKNATSTTPGAPEVVKFNPSTGIAEPDMKNQNYDMSSYDMATVRLLGTAQGKNGENITVVSVDRDNESVLTEFNDLLAARGRNLDPKVKKAMYSAYTSGEEYDGTNSNIFQNIISDLNKTPKTLQLGVSGYSFELEKPLQSNTVEFVKEGIQHEDPTMVANTLNNYASVGLLLNTNRIKDYNEKAAKLQNIAKAKDEAAFISETTPSGYYTFDPENNTYSGFLVRYKYSEEDGQMVAQVYKNYYNEDMEALNTKPEPFAKHFIKDFSSPSALYSIDLLYGVGGQEHLLKDNKGQVFIPANMVTAAELNTYIK